MIINEKKKEIAAIFGYGVNVDKKRESLLDEVVEGIVNGQINAVIASGGRTSRKNNPGVSEAAVIYAYLYKKLIDRGYRLVPKFWVGEYCSPHDLGRIESICETYPQRKGQNLREIDFYFEDRAITTRENVLFMKALLENYKVWEGYELVAYCNKAHRIKISALAVCVWGYFPKTVAYSIDSGLKEYVKQVVIYTVPTVLALRIKFLRELEDNRREKQMDNN